MNKQQLAQKIWASANQMRSKIEANEYKDSSSRRARDECPRPAGLFRFRGAAGDLQMAARKEPAFR